MSHNPMAPNTITPKEDGCCSINFLKYFLFIFNFFCLIAGGTVFGVGIWTILVKHEFGILLTTATYTLIAYILIFAGSLAVLASILGCFGVSYEHRYLLLIYTFLLLLIFLLEAKAGIISYVYEEQVVSELKVHLNSTFLDNYKVVEEKTTAIDEMQRKFKCCGAIRFEDWQYSVWLQRHPEINNSVPDSCCKTESPFCGVRDHPSNIYYNGCIYQFSSNIRENLVVLGAVGLGICVLQVFGMIFSCCLYIKLKGFED